MEERCKICSRIITSNKSKKRGVGSMCSKHADLAYSSLFELNEPFDKKSVEVLEAMNKRSSYVSTIKCPTCGYKCLKPVSWTHSSCIICQLSKRVHVYEI